MNVVAFVCSSSDRDMLEYGDCNLSEVIDELGKRDIEADIVAFDEDTLEYDWPKYDLILPTPALSYTAQYQRLLKVNCSHCFHNTLFN